VAATSPEARLGQATRQYRHLDAPARVYAHLKLRLDPMFAQLDALVGDGPSILDVGAGLGTASVWLATGRADRTFVALEPQPFRARVASWVLRGRGEAYRASCPGLPEALEDRRFDTILLLDVAHYLDDTALYATLAELRNRLEPEGQVIVRDTIPSAARWSFVRWAERSLMRLRRERPHFRTQPKLIEMLEAAGLQPRVELGAWREKTWFVATAQQ
jgi:SAM-dependent methyltransferase